jgi:hypothetical protein
MEKCSENMGYDRFPDMKCPFRINANSIVVDFPLIFGWSFTEVLGISVINTRAVSKVSKSTVIGK